MTDNVLVHITKDYIYADLAGAGVPPDIKDFPVEAALELPTVDAEVATFTAAEWDPDLPATVRWFYNGTLPAGGYVLYSRVILTPPREPVTRHGYVYLI